MGFLHLDLFSPNSAHNLKNLLNNCSALNIFESFLNFGGQTKMLHRQQLVRQHLILFN